MHEPAAVGTADVSVEYHMFFVAEPGLARDAPSAGEITNGLVASAPGVAVIITGASSGLVTLTTEVHRSAPPRVTTQGWEEVVDHSIEALSGELRVACLMDDPPALPLLTPFGPGHYRMRLHVRGRDFAPDGVAFEPLEKYLLLIWPAPAQPDEIYLQSDNFGASRRHSAASAPPPLPRQPADSYEQAKADRLRRFRERRR